MRPVIGVTPLWDDERQSLWMLPGYMEGLRSVGLLPVMLPLTDDDSELSQLAALCDGFLFTGGQDVSPEIYGETPLSGLVVPCPARDRMETRLFSLALSSDKPVLGICRGIQLINALLGGTLYQDLPLQHPSLTAHHQSAPYYLPSHRVSVIKDSPLHNLLGTDTLAVNSYHHQAVRKLSPALLPMAYAEDGLVEAVYKPDARFVWAFQWHPEYSYTTDAAGKAIFAAFADALQQKS